MSRLTGLALGPDASAVAVHDPLHRRKADARALELGRRVEPLEWREQAMRLFHVETRAVVSDAERGATLTSTVPMVIRGCQYARRVLPCVADEVLHRRAHEAGSPRTGGRARFQRSPCVRVR